MTDSQFLFAAADFGYMINLFNLMPVLPLDGGRATSVLSPWIVAAGSAGMCAAVFNGSITSPMGHIIALMSVFGTYQAFFGERERFHENTGAREKMRVGASYLALVVGLMGAMAINNRYRKSPAQIRHEKGQRPQSDMERQLLSFAEEHKDPDHDVRTTLESQDPWLANNNNSKRQ